MHWWMDVIILALGVPALFVVSGEWQRRYRQREDDNR